MLEYANIYEFPMKHSAPKEFVKLNPSEQMDWLMRYYNCSVSGLAARLHLDESSIRRWKNKNTISNSAQKYLYEVASHPERFNLFQ